MEIELFEGYRLNCDDGGLPEGQYVTAINFCTEEEYIGKDLINVAVGFSFYKVKESSLSPIDESSGSQPYWYLIQDRTGKYISTEQISENDVLVSLVSDQRDALHLESKEDAQACLNEILLNDGEWNYLFQGFEFKPENIVRIKNRD